VRLRALVYAALAAGLALGWQGLTVHYNYGGDWSALFYTGSYTAMPPAVADEAVYRFPGGGFDGQYYHLVAHDPLLRADTAHYVDNPRLRWRRILLPALAFAAAGGDSDRVESAYAAVVLAFVFAGAFWLARWCLDNRVHPAWSLAFLLVPAVAVSLDRFTIDVALAALCAAFAFYGTRARMPLAVLVLAPFARETGAILIAACGLDAVLRRDRCAAVLSAAAAVPYAVWLWYLAGRAPADQTVFVSYIPFAGLLARTLDPFPDSMATRWLFVAAMLEYLAVLAIWLAVALVAIWLWKGKRDRLTLAAGLFALVFVAFLGQPQVWAGVYTFGRTMSPLLILLALAGAASRSWVCLLPLAMTVPRILWQLAPQWAGIRHGIFALLH
jgi:hypothetical protein